MRGNARWLLGVCGLALAVPCSAPAAPYDDPPSPGAVSTSPAPDEMPQHRHRTWFARRHCVECQRAYVKAHDGVDVPAPPPLEPEAGVHRHMAGVQAETCSVCQGQAMAQGEVTVTSAGAGAPGYAVVGGPAGAPGAAAPGYAVVGGDLVAGSEPAPIGVSSAGRAAGDPRLAAMGPRGAAGPYDPAVVPTNNVPPAQMALAGPTGDRPHIIGHLLGLPRFGYFERKAAEKERQKHASIAYDQPNQPVHELPASMVYGPGGGK